VAASGLNPFANRIAVLASMHRKEQVIAPILERSLGLTLQVPEDFDTDRFGTFTRDIARVGTQQAVARRKAEQVLAQTGATLALASEGSFGPHPTFPYLACNRELVLLLDQEHELEIIGTASSTQTNYRHQLVSNLAQAEQFAEQVGFPSHGLVVIANPEHPQTGEIFKGITELAALETALEMALRQSTSGQVHLETDMRALVNPTRMQVIAQATENLVEKLRSCCPACGSPGFEVVKTLPGLPCSECGLPTSLTRAVLYRCPKCSYSQEQKFPEGLEMADPGQCNYCNP
jgi:Zn finger protein HypA/HybF involved in hydrogenase expression